MTNIGTGISDEPKTSDQLDAHADQANLTVAPPGAKTPYWLLWSIGIAAFVLCIVAFVLWGINGASTLFDMIVALCT